MMDSLLKRIEKNRKAHIRWLAMVLCLSMIVSLGTFAGFHKTAVAKTYTKEVLDCPFAQEGASPVAHVHNDDCYDGDTLVCTLPEREAHTHTEACFAEQRRLTCVLEENPGHQHSDACYAAREEITCGLEENPGHVHNGTCFNDSGVLICTMAEGDGAHTHTADCFTTVYDLICDIPEGEGAHTHTDECYTTERVQVCGQEELPVHVHGPECIRTVEWNEGEDEPVVTDEPVESTVPEMPVSDPDADLESVEDWNREFENFELSGNWARDLILVAATQQGRGESPNNFEAFLNDAGDAWVRYGYTRYGAWYGVPCAEEWSAMFVSFCLRYACIPEENVPNNPTAAFMAESFQKGELFAGRDYVPAVGDLIFFDTVVDDDIVNIDHMGIVYHVDAENGTINTVEGDRTDAVATFGYHLDDEQIVGYGILPQNPNYNYEEEITEDELDDFIVMTTDEEQPEEIPAAEDVTAPAAPMPAQSWERTAGGIKVSVEAPEGAFPENTRIAVTPVNGNSLKDTVSDAVSGEVLEVQAVDITFFDSDGNEIEPAIPIRVTMTPAATQHAEEKASVVHVDVAEQTAELIEQAAGTEFDNSEVVFDADAFTIYAIVYTYQVEYEYEVDGKTFTSSMPGAENMTLTQIVEGLGIVGEEELETFVSKIASIASTNEEVAVVTENNEIRVLKDGEAKIVITMQDGAKFHIDVRAEGETSASNETATVSTKGDLYLPADAELKTEVLDEVKSESAIAAVEAKEGTADSNAAAAETAYQVFDISLENVEADQYNGFQVEVKLPENVVGKNFHLYHVHDGKVDELELDNVDPDGETMLLESVSFVTPSFSEFVLSYTVDFEYSVNGKMYQFSLPGGGFVSFTDLVEVLGIIGDTNPEENEDETGSVIAENAEENATNDVAEENSVNSDTNTQLTLGDVEVSEATREFVADVASVEFSSPSLVDVSKVENETTVGQIKENRGLECEYSAELTEEQIVEINAQTVKAGDFALISVSPFTSEETLTVTMKDGEVFTIQVTDAQIKKTVIDAKGDTWEITVTYSEDAQIPDGAELVVDEILPEDERYEEYYSEAVAAANGAADDEADDETDDEVDPEIEIAEDNYARFFDITIMNGEEKVEPEAPVKVDIKLADTPETDNAWEVIHFDAAGPVVMQSERVAADQADAVEMVFDTEGFSVFGVITVPSAQPDPDVTDLDGKSFTISHDSRYVTTAITPIENNNNTNGFGKTSSAAQAARWYFERPEGSSGNTYYIYTLVNDQKQYMNLTRNSNNTDRANASLSGTPQSFTVTKDGNNYRLATQSGGTTYYLDEHNGNNGNAFAGWHGTTNNGQLTLNFPKQPVMQNSGEYMTLVKYEGKYYIVNNDCSLTEVNYDEATKTVGVEDPMLWTVNRNNPNGHIYFNSTEVGFDWRQIASGWYRRYLDPSSATAFLEETNGNGPGHVDIDAGDKHTAHGVTYLEHHVTDRTNVENATTVSIDNTLTGDSSLYKIYHGNSYLGVVSNGDGTFRLAGQQSGENAAEFLFASPTEVKSVDWKQHTVDHIDISIAGTANVSVPLAYGKYYGSTEGDKEEPILTVDDNMKVELSEAQMVDPGQLRITADDMKRATITATRADNGRPIDNAFYVTGYSGNVRNGTSNDQVRIEGSFLVADLRGTEYESINADSYKNNYGGYRDNVNTARKNNTVEYTVTVVKALTYNLIDPELGQLYDADGNPLTVTVDVAFSASFNYWDSENECPALVNPDGGPNSQTGYSTAAWQAGGIDPSGMSGMDFVLGGNADDPNSPLTALEITKVIMDENGNRIELKVPVTNYFDIYEKKNATKEQKNGVAGLHVVDNLNQPEWHADSRDATIRDGYTYWRTKRVTVDETGSSIVFDFNATDAMYYIVEKHDEESLPQIVMDKAGNEYVYVKTYFETEYVRRDDEAGTHDEYSNKTLHPQAMHLTEDYTRASTGDYAYASIPEVAGKFTKLDGTQKKEGFLEFYVYNIYRPVYGDISVNKQWQNEEGSADEWLADVTFKLRKKTVTMSGEGDNQTQTVTYSDVARPDYMSDDWSDTITVTSATGEAKWEELPELGENESYVVIEHDIAGHEGTVISDILRDELSGAITSFKLTKGGKTYTYDVTNGLLGDEGGTTINKQRKETDITLKKVDKDSLNEENPDLLKGASFTVSKYLNGSYQGMDTTWGTSGSMTVSDDKNQDGTYTLNGKFVFQGLQEGYYQIEETRFPDGYIKVSGNARFKVEENANHELEISLISNPDNLLLLEDNKLTIVVGNTPGIALPNTGGPGTRLFTILGSILTLGAGVLLWRRRRTI